MPQLLRVVDGSLLSAALKPGCYNRPGGLGSNIVLCLAGVGRVPGIHEQPPFLLVAERGLLPKSA